tara:strand:+ start:406 stop:516 length:111 start_codon:yes stop_codon:yes gene_type:complete
MKHLKQKVEQEKQHLKQQKLKLFWVLDLLIFQEACD